MRWLFILFVSLSAVQSAFAGDPPRARDLGVPFEGVPGPLNAITDVAGVTVGHTTLIENLPEDRAARTGVTAVLPRGENTLGRPVFGAWFALNGNGEVTGTTWIEESGQLEGPVMLTNTHSVGVVRDATIAWRIHAAGPDASGYYWSLPVVAETWDGHLNDINGFHVKAEHVATALEAPAAGRWPRATSVAAPAWSATSSSAASAPHHALSRSSAGPTRSECWSRRITGCATSWSSPASPIGRDLREHRVYSEPDPNAAGTGSIIVVVATDAPLLPHQLKRVARRPALGLGRSVPSPTTARGTSSWPSPPPTNPWATATVSDPSLVAQRCPRPALRRHRQAVEEAVVNAMVAARDMTGDEGRYAKALPQREFIEAMGRSEHNEKPGGEMARRPVVKCRFRPVCHSTSLKLNSRMQLKPARFDPGSWGRSRRPR